MNNERFDRGMLLDQRLEIWDEVFDVGIIGKWCDGHKVCAEMKHLGLAGELWQSINEHPTRTAYTHPAGGTPCESG